MTLTVTILGSSGTYAAAGNACSGYLVRTEDTAVWLDAGPGTLANLQRHVDPRSLDAIVLSHVHPDHWLELPIARHMYRYGLGVDGPPIYGCAELKAAAEILVPVLDDTFEWHTIADGDRTLIGDIDFAWSRTDHPVETLASCFSSLGQTGCYTADTGPGWTAAAFDLDIDLALWEAGAPSAGQSGAVHSAASEAGAGARAADVDRLVLTHLLPGRDPDVAAAEAAETFGQTVGVAVPGRTYVI